MNKAMARHYLRETGWTEPQMRMAERVLRHDGSRRSSAALATLQRFADVRDEPNEREAWRALVERLEAGS